MAKIKDEFLRLNVVINGVAAGSRQFSGLKKDLDLNSKSLKELRKDLKLAKIAISNAVPGTENFKRLQKEIQATSARIKELQTGASGVKKLFSGWGVAVTAAVALVAKGIRTLASTIGDFEQANVNLATVLGKNVSEIGELTRSAKQLGATTQYTASEVTSLQMELAKLGFTESQIKGMSKATLNFATAVGTDLASAAQLAGATLRIFDLRADQTDNALGIMAVATNKSALNFSFLQTAMSTVGPVAKTFGFSLRDTTTLLGALANAGFDASSAATATRNILLNLANANGKLAKSIGEPVKNFNELMTAFDSLKKKGIDLAGALELTDKRSVSAFTAFLDGADAARQLHENLGDVEGDLDRIADERMNTLNGSILKMKSAWEGFILSLDNSKGILKWAVDRLTDIVTLARQLMTSKSDKIAERIDSTVEDYVRKGTTDEEINTYLANARGRRDAALQSYNKAAATVNRDPSQVLYWQRQKETIDEEIFVIEQAQLKLAKLRSEGNAGGSGNNGTGFNPGSGNGPGGGNGGSGGGNGSATKQWSLQSDEAYLTAKAELTRKYNEGEIASADEFNEQLYQAEISAYSARLASHKDAKADRLKIEADMQAAIKKHKDEGLKKENEIAEAAKKIQDELDDYVKTASQKKLNEENRRYEKEKKLYENNASMLELIEKKHKKNEELIKIESYNESLKISEQAHSLSIKRIESEYQEKIAAHKRGSAGETALRHAMSLEIAENEIQYLTALQSELKQIVEDGAIIDAEIPAEQMLAYVVKLKEVTAQLHAAQQLANEGKSSAFSGAGGGSLFGVSQNDLELMTSGVDGATTSAQRLATAFQLAGGAAQEGFKIASKAIELVNAKEKKEFQEYTKENDEKQKLLQDRLSAGTISQAQYNAEIERLEEEKAAKEEEMAIKQAKRQKALSLAQAIINTALSISTTLAQFGTTPWGIAAAAIAATMGAVEIAMIAAQPIEGAEEGGSVLVSREQDGKRYNARLAPDKRGYINRPTVLVGENGEEYVVPASGVSNPTLAPILGTIETARRNGTLRSLDFRAALSPAVSGHVSGGFVATGAASSSPGNVTASLGNIPEKMDAILAKMDNIKAYVTYLGKGGIKEAEDKYARARSQGVLQ